MGDGTSIALFSVMLARLGLSMVLLAPAALIACDGEASDEALVREARPFVDGVAKDTEGGAFRIVLNTGDGALEVGQNQLVVRVGFHDPDDPLDPGQGIPGAQIELLAWMPLDDGLMDRDLAVQYVGDGEYLIDGLELDRPGVWQLDMAIAVGATMRENVSFAFVIED
jgi:hypothetical protein